MSQVPEDLKYARSHEWVRQSGEVATVGITDHAQAELTDIVFVELPSVGKKLMTGQACAVVESVKTASDIYAPVSGEVVEVNSVLSNDPGLINREPFAGGWFFKVRVTPVEKSELMDAKSYRAQIEGK